MILICAKQDDAHAVRVAAILRERHQAEVFIFDTSAFPNSLFLTGTFGNGSNGIFLSNYSGTAVDLSKVSSFWWRRPQLIEVDPRITDTQARSFAYHECVSALYGTLQCCDALWVNDLPNDTTADYKPYQLKVAAALGFSVPETLITNSPDVLMGFWNRHQRQLVYKAFNQRAVVWRPTRLLKEEDLALIANLQHAPVIFQPLVPGIRDVRVTVIGEHIFATEFDIEQLDDIDYRTHMMDIPCRPHQLPAELEAKIQRFMTTLGLEYGGIDFRLTPDGNYVFFEINTAGEFLYLEDRTAQPIAAAMALHLAGGRPARPIHRAVS